jgi:adenylate cyclase
LRGLAAFLRGTKEANEQAQQLYEKALELDPQYAAAYAQLDRTYLQQYFTQWSTDQQTLEQAFTLARKAVELEDSLPLAHSLLGIIYQRKTHHDEAVREGERALALDPNNADSHVWQSLILGPAGRAEKAIEMAKKAMHLNPYYPPWYILALGISYHHAWRNEETIATLKRYLFHDPNSLVAYLALTCSYSDVGHHKEARAGAAELLRISPNFSIKGWSQTQRVKDPAALERHINNLHKAGLK